LALGLGEADFDFDFEAAFGRPRPLPVPFFAGAFFEAGDFDRRAGDLDLRAGDLDLRAGDFEPDFLTGDFELLLVGDFLDGDLPLTGDLDFALLSGWLLVAPGDFERLLVAFLAGDLDLSRFSSLPTKSEPSARTSLSAFFFLTFVLPGDCDAFRFPVELI